MRLVALNIAITLLLPLAVHKPQSHRRQACGSFVAKQHRLYVYVERGSAGCPEARRVLQAWFVDAGMTNRYGRWTCFDSFGVALAGGQIQRCRHGSRNEIADYDHRVPTRSARM